MATMEGHLHLLDDAFPAFLAFPEPGHRNQDDGLGCEGSCSCVSSLRSSWFERSGDDSVATSSSFSGERRGAVSGSGIVLFKMAGAATCRLVPN